MTVQKYGVEAIPLTIFLFMVVMLSSAGGASIDG